MFPTIFPASLARPGPKQMTSVSFSAGAALPLSVDVKEVALIVSNPFSVATVKALADPQGTGELAVL